MGDNEQGSSFAEKGLGIDRQLSYHESAIHLHSKKGQQHPSDVSKSVASRPREVILPYSSVWMRLHLESQDYPDNQTSALKALNHRYTGYLRFENIAIDHLFQPHCSKQGHLKPLSQTINLATTSNLLLHSLIERLYEEGANDMISL